ncbi:PAQR family membrane homeostasis protein TrhA [Alloiococcus sp. CFN-8]|uniref:PAQR family membrane homeostasis protein TrhA n=1 Tax=Alloiococcus sp. CFN-8 TaxID=3416081 RepID=UPI003CED5DAC
MSKIYEVDKKTRSFEVKDPGSALTHFIAFIAAVLGTPLLLIHSLALGASNMSLISFSIFMLSMILLYGASTTYHTFDVSEQINKLLRKIDHMMIFILIAGSYTPVCLIGIGGKTGRLLLILVWSIALAGIILKGFWITCPKWFSSVIYIGMGWVCLLAFPELIQKLPTEAFLWLLAGGVIYSIGGIIYALKLPLFNKRFRHFGSHEIFHLFVMGGSLCHFIMMYEYLAVM